MLHRKPRILVVGSFVMDVIATTEKIPGSGQTVYGKSFHMAPAERAPTGAQCAAGGGGHHDGLRSATTCSANSCWNLFGLPVWIPAMWWYVRVSTPAWAM